MKQSSETALINGVVWFIWHRIKITHKDAHPGKENNVWIIRAF